MKMKRNKRERHEESGENHYKIFLAFLFSSWIQKQNKWFIEDDTENIITYKKQPI